MQSFTYYKQLNSMDCGPTCLRMVAKFYNKHFNLDSIRNMTGFGKEGTSLLGISEAAERIGFRTRGVQINLEQLFKFSTYPSILHWGQDHFVVLISIKKSIFKKEHILTIADPAMGILDLNENEFSEKWCNSLDGNGEKIGIVLFLENTPKLFGESDEIERKLSWDYILKYIKDYRWQVSQVFIALIFTSILQLIFPFLTQSIVDTGISNRNLNYVSIVLMAQLMLIFSKSFVEFIRTRILLNISIKLNLSILSDFWIKLTRLPLSYFDSHHTGDILQRIGDNRQIQQFLTGTALNTIFSFLNFLIFAFILAQYNVQLFFVFAFGSIIYVLWVQLFLKFRRKLNYQNFNISAKENNATLQLVQGMQEIKLNNAEKIKRWEWENIQSAIFKLNFKTLTYNQIQQAGALLINQGKDLFITFLVAGLVIEGKLTLGAMLAIQYIIGQLSGPIEQFVGFVQSAQDAKISMERLNEIHNLSNEEKPDISYLNQLPENKTIFFNNVSFVYPGAGNDAVLNSINIQILEKKITAIVGVSGSGKTTLLKLLLKFYDSYKGEIMIGATNYRFLNPSFWRSQCGAVLQDGYIFNDSIAKNIAVGDEFVDFDKLIRCCKTSNILSFIETLPNGFNTKLGSEGVGISQGQKQRLLIARAIYKNPEYLFFDEATNALDANNEKVIVENLQEFFNGRTVIVVAHRLSTVKNADKIIVLHKGTIVEEGSHKELCELNGMYYELVKNQLELGN